MRAMFRAVWPNLPVLLLSSVAVCLGAACVAVISPGITPLSSLAAAVLVGTPMGGLVWSCSNLWFHTDVTVGQLVRAAPFWSGRALAVTSVPGVLVALTLVSLEVWSQSRQIWVLAPLALGGALSVVLILAAGVALPLSVRDPRLRGLPLWICALRVVARGPVRALGVPAVVVLGMSACTNLSASLFLLLPAPLALVMVAAAFAVPTTRRLQR